MEQSETVKIALKLERLGVGYIARYIGEENYRGLKLCEVSELSCNDYVALSLKGEGWEKQINSETDLFIVTLAMGSEYSGTLVEISNYQSILEFRKDNADSVDMFCTWGNADIYRVYGGYGSYGIAVGLGYTVSELWEGLEGLADYPVWNEELYSNLLFEAEAEEVESLANGDFRTELISVWEDEYSLEEVPINELATLIRACMERGNIEAINEQSDSIYIRVNELIEEVTETDILGLSNIVGLTEETEEKIAGFMSYEKAEQFGQLKLMEVSAWKELMTQ